MEFQYLGANCIRIATKKAVLVFDDNLSTLGTKSITKNDDISLVTNEKTISTNDQGKMQITFPGEYEVSGISIVGIAARGHMDPEDEKNAVVYRIDVEDIRVGVLGHIYADLDDAQLEQLGTIDVLFVPVGNSGYTLDALGVLKLIKKIEPSIIVPTHYSDANLTYEVPQQSLEEALKGVGMEPAETVQNYKLKAADIPDSMKLVVLERS